MHRIWRRVEYTLPYPASGEAVTMIKTRSHLTTLGQLTVALRPPFLLNISNAWLKSMSFRMYKHKCESIFIKHHKLLRENPNWEGDWEQKDYVLGFKHNKPNKIMVTWWLFVPKNVHQYGSATSRVFDQKNSWDFFNPCSGEMQIKCFEVGPFMEGNGTTWPCLVQEKNWCCNDLWCALQTCKWRSKVGGLLDCAYCLCRLNSQPLWLPLYKDETRRRKRTPATQPMLFFYLFQFPLTSTMSIFLHIISFLSTP